MEDSCKIDVLSTCIINLRRYILVSLEIGITYFLSMSYLYDVTWLIDDLFVLLFIQN
jgi:hypothetical protein